MSQPLIQVENLSKAYRIGLKEEIPDSLMGAMTGWVKAPLRNWKRLRNLNTFAEAAAHNGNGSEGHDESAKAADDIVWALKDVSFDVHEGEVVGIIGRNGAGKSTLLKVLSRITEPTSGRAVIRGRVSSLLEVGTGFHPELTGRENVYMNGTILGMTKREIDRKFDEIVEFSGVEKFLDTPIKRYSSGMKVRLAFAVAAHLDPEILIIDEVLAVGDAEFQSKCLRKMHNVASSGRTVLFVSHNMAALQALCSRGIVLHDGSVKRDSTTTHSVNYHLASLVGQSRTDIATRCDRGGNGSARIVDCRVVDDENNLLTHLQVGEPGTFDFALDRAVANPRLIFAIYDGIGNLVADFDSQSHAAHDRIASRACQSIRCAIDRILLVPGIYRLNVALFVDKALADHVEAALILDVSAGVVDERPIPTGTRGVTVFPHTWSSDRP